MPDTAKIEVSFREASLAGAFLKLQSRKVQELAAIVRATGNLTAAVEFEGNAAALDEVADKMYRPFLTAGGCERVTEHVDDPTAPRRSRSKTVR